MQIIKRMLKKIIRIIQNIKINIAYIFNSKLEKINLARIEILFITHNQGGGTKHFEDMYLKDKKNFLIIRSCAECNGKYVLVEDEKGNSVLMRSSNVQSLFFVDKNFKQYKQIIVNSLINYKELENIVNLIINQKKQTNCTVECLIHDFYIICANPNLFVDGWFCELDCETKKCSDLFVQGTEYTIKEWRNIFYQLLDQSDRILCFSESSKEILIRVYSEKIKDRVYVKPHDCSYIRFSEIEDLDNKDIHFGIVGDVTADFKGKRVVKRIINLFGNEVDISLVGVEWWKYGIFKRKVKYTGKYKNTELKEIIEREKISIIIFPSCWPETFSYVLSEIMALNIPIMCFNMGAQGERVAKYTKGVLFNNEEQLISHIAQMIRR